MFTQIYDARGPIYWHGLNSIPAWIINHIYYNVLDYITYNREVWEWISNFIPHFIGHVITYPCSDYSWTMLVKGAPEAQTYLTEYYDIQMINKLVTYGKTCNVLRYCKHVINWCIVLMDDDLAGIVIKSLW